MEHSDVKRGVHERMVELYRWEDSPSLRHHCGFCERPLHHPTARTSCFGNHCEPCVRFHQALFMRNRGHTCMYCASADEAHRKRHTEIAELLRSIYELCGLDAYLCPGKPMSDEVGTNLGANAATHDEYLGERGREARSIAVLQSPKGLTKKERKALKRLGKAASRPKVLTQQDVSWIDDVLHPMNANPKISPGPRNTKEVQEIEDILKHNARVYNSNRHRKDQQRFETIDDANVDFDEEMERILNVLRITEMHMKNVKSSGMESKDLKKFDTFVTKLKTRISEDLVLVKKDQMETAMRRDSYYRYTSRASNDIMEERYQFRDRRTGQRIDSVACAVHVDVEQKEIIPEENGDEDTENHIPSVDDTDLPDLRHLSIEHKRVKSQDLMDIIPVSSPEPRMAPAIINKRPPNSLKIVYPKCSPAKPNPRVSPLDVEAEQTSSLTTLIQHQQTELMKSTMKEMAKSPSNHASIALGLSQTSEALAELTELLQPLKVDKVERDELPIASRLRVDEDVSSEHPAQLIPAIKKDKLDLAVKPKPSEPGPLETENEPPKLVLDSALGSSAKTSDEWKQYQSHLDQAQPPIHPGFDSNVPRTCDFCERTTSSLRWNTAFNDTVFRPVCIAYCCGVGRSWSFGNYNRLHAMRLLEELEEDPEIRGKLIIMDQNLCAWAADYENNIPPSSFREEAIMGLQRMQTGPLADDILDFRRALTRNRKQKTLHISDVMKIVKSLESHGRKICYCASRVPSCLLTSTGEIDYDKARKHNEFFECSYRECASNLFHRSCFLKAQMADLSTFYCRDCENKMLELATTAVKETVAMGKAI